MIRSASSRVKTTSMDILPPFPALTVRSGRYSISEASVPRRDAVVFVLDAAQAGRALAQLPYAG
ncbi:MAG TPA: hypothetical protein VLM41_05055, partial [Steroidobacteraceae bacterium]|nr:hypothetical protein [Steroidobacteraceae bacterium]